MKRKNKRKIYRLFLERQIFIYNRNTCLAQFRVRLFQLKRPGLPAERTKYMNRREETLKVITEGLGNITTECPVIRMLADEVAIQFDIVTDINWDVQRALSVLVTIEDLYLREKMSEAEDLYLREKMSEAVEVIRSAFEQMDDFEAMPLLEMAEACGAVNQNALGIFVARFLQQSKNICLFAPLENCMRKARGGVDNEQM